MNGPRIGKPGAGGQRPPDLPLGRHRPADQPAAQHIDRRKDTARTAARGGNRPARAQGRRAGRTARHALISGVGRAGVRPSRLPPAAVGSAYARRSRCARQSDVSCGFAASGSRVGQSASSASARLLPATSIASVAAMNRSRSPSSTPCGVRGFHPGAQVLHHLIGLQHIGPDLVAPARIALVFMRGVDRRRCACPAPADKAATSARSSQMSRFWCCDFIDWRSPRYSVGKWVIRTAESVVLTCWPPAPDDR